METNKTFHSYKVNVLAHYTLKNTQSSLEFILLDRVYSSFAPEIMTRDTNDRETRLIISTTEATHIITSRRASGAKHQPFNISAHVSVNSPAHNRFQKKSCGEYSHVCVCVCGGGFQI